MALIQLIYVSTAVIELPEHMLDAILESSVRHNGAHGITGLLLYRRGSFMQVLEGEAADVDEVYRRICRDQRHYAVMELLREEIAERSFARWSMGFHRVEDSDLQDRPEFAPLLFKGFSAESIGARPGKALHVLQSFS